MAAVIVATRPPGLALVLLSVFVVLQQAANGRTVVKRSSILFPDHKDYHSYFPYGQTFTRERVGRSGHRGIMALDDSTDAKESSAEEQLGNDHIDFSETEIGPNAEKHRQASTTDTAVHSTTPRTSKPASAILFPDQLENKEFTEEAYTPECDGVPYMAYNDAGECQFLMMQGSCPEGYWFILKRNTTEAHCQRRACPTGQVLFQKVCRRRDASDVCPEGMTVLVNEYGEGVCDCAKGQVFWPRRGRCYPAYRQGPCEVGQYLTISGEERLARCTKNECVLDESVLWKNQGCYRLQDAERSPCLNGRLDVNPESMQLECLTVVPNAVFDLPIVRCSPGSRLDFQGRCKRELFQKFRTNLGSARNTQRGRALCPPGFVETPDGLCVRTVSGGLG